jgi:CheY-like chemotaxis protein
MLPDTEGTDLVKQIIPLLSEPKPPIIAVTAYSTLERIAAAKAIGITGYVVKPVSLPKIEAAITSSSPIVQIRRTFTPQQTSDKCDFAPLSRLENGKQLVAEYGLGLVEAWQNISDQLQKAPVLDDNIRRDIHAFRSRVLVVSATEAGDQIALLEDAARANEREACQKLASVIDELVQEIAQAAKENAFIFG